MPLSCTGRGVRAEGHLATGCPPGRSDSRRVRRERSLNRLLAVHGAHPARSGAAADHRRRVGNAAAFFASPLSRERHHGRIDLRSMPDSCMRRPSGGGKDEA